MSQELSIAFRKYLQLVAESRYVLSELQGAESHLSLEISMKTHTAYEDLNQLEKDQIFTIGEAIISDDRKLELGNKLSQEKLNAENTAIRMATYFSKYPERRSENTQNNA